MALNRLSEELSEQEYKNARSKFIQNQESNACAASSPSLSFYFDDQGRLSIGYGVKINLLNGASIANLLNEYLNKPLSEYQLSVLEAYTQIQRLNWEGSPLNGQKITDERVLNELSTIQLKSTQTADLLLDKQLDKLENQLDRFLGDSSLLPASNERIAILSVLHDCYGTNDILPEDTLGIVKTVLIKNESDPGQRARLWTKIKFGFNFNNSKTTYARRSKEAELFSLFAEGGKPTDDSEAKATAYVLKEKYQTIDDHLSEMGIEVEDELNPIIDTAIYDLGELETTFIGTDTAYRNDKGILVNASDEIIGTNDDDVIYGQGGNDFIYGENGDDELHGGSGNDKLEGGKGDDIVKGGGGDDYIEGNKGDDNLYAGQGNDELIGNEGDDDLYGELGVNILKGGKGFDVYVVGQKDTVEDSDASGEVVLDGAVLKGGQRELSNPKNIFYDEQNNLTYELKGTTLNVNGLTIKNFKNGDLGILLQNLQIDGSDDEDKLIGGKANEIIYGYDGDDYLEGNEGIDQLHGGKGYDTYQVGKEDIIYDEDGKGKILLNGVKLDGVTVSRSNISFSGWEDYCTYKKDGLSYMLDGSMLRVNGLIVNDFKNGDFGISLVMEGTDDNERFSGYRDFNEIFKAGAGDDYIYGGGGDDVAYGENGNDKITGGDGNDKLIGGDGDDELIGDIYKYEDRDHYRNEGGDDHLDGGNGNDWLSGGGGNDTLIGGDGDDYLVGGILKYGNRGYYRDEDGDDHLEGGNGNDRLSGGSGNDTLIGGSGNDIYYYHEQGGQDIIENSGIGADIVHFVGIHSERISYHRVNDDLIMLVDEDLEQKVTVKDHFQGPEKSINYVQFYERRVYGAEIRWRLTDLPQASMGDTGMDLSATNSVSHLISAMATMPDNSSGSVTENGTNIISTINITTPI
ncbi:hypothetical protein KCM76_14280 [Zooshikella marina]|uniref:calcium-binding protein n=1 Tax=Zooshikella ganghwensis TaxID=202772 RepID=UPI001BAF1976|nr:calcium-binding protein [Zooshikella ganghwensis]MBU2707160.1 hypothetical protein [Zooshikella ganghwensis]